MRTLGIDFGEKRIGLAISDPLGILATPIETLDSSEMDLVIPKLAETISDHTVTKIVVGIPWTLSGKSGPQTKKTFEFISLISDTFEIPIKQIDERFTSLQAEKKLRLVDKRSRKKQKKIPKGLIDSVSAAIILQTYLDTK
ncbi:MAG: Holliday junction resolvase RuvX [Chloroflexi bacterium]|nr:Holliday junction resolvase RuvX [Chloroflexota bacterium]MBH26756.1 Holliday junction resolvase RuvX [Chloroflexota bacterium]